MSDLSSDFHIETVIKGGEIQFVAFFGSAIASYIISQTNDKRRTLTILHTVTEPEFRGRGLARKVFDFTVHYARNNNYKIIPICSYADSIFQKEADLQDVLFKGNKDK